MPTLFGMIGRRWRRRLFGGAIAALIALTAAPVLALPFLARDRHSAAPPTPPFQKIPPPPPPVPIAPLVPPAPGLFPGLPHCRPRTPPPALSPLTRTRPRSSSSSSSPSSSSSCTTFATTAASPIARWLVPDTETHSGRAS